MKKKKVIPGNFLEKIPVHHPHITWKTEEDGTVTVCVENTGWANRVAQKFFGRPKVSYVHLDEMGSFLWPLLDGETNLTRLGELVDAHFGEAAQPLYPRLVKYFQILESYHFICWKSGEKA